MNQIQNKMVGNPKIILWDIETTPLVTYRWQFDRSPYINHNSIVEDWSIICVAWKELGSSKVNAVSIKNVGDDYEVVKKIRDVLAEADILIHHNGDKFDLKNLNTRIMVHGLPPLPYILTIDTLREARKVAGFTSNRLDYLAKILIGEGKLHVDFDLWKRVMHNDKKAVKEMVEYNKVDVIRLEEVYEKLKPYMQAHPHIGALNGDAKNCSCAACGSTNIKKNGIRITVGGGKRQEIQCKECGSYSRIIIYEPKETTFGLVKIPRPKRLLQKS